MNFLPTFQLFPIFLLSFTSAYVYPFDFVYYTQKNSINLDNNGGCWFGSALNHFAHEGKVLGLQTVPTKIDNTNFDWEYYVTHNNLSGISTEHAAYQHYFTYGKKHNLEYCKRFSIVILFHLYDFDLMDEMITRINYFIKNNPHNDYRIKINIPVTSRILSLHNVSTKLSNVAQREAKSYLQKRCSLLGNDITYLTRNSVYTSQLYNLCLSLKESFSINKDDVEIVFSENRGMDVGGFFTLLHELVQEAKPFDFLVKVHTKKGAYKEGGGSVFGEQFGSTWRECLLSFLNIKINKILRTYDCIYSCKLAPEHDRASDFCVFKNMQTRLYDMLGIEQDKAYVFCAGTTFIAPYAFFQVVRTWDLKQLYALFKEGKPYLGFEHIFERVFGHVFGELKLNTLCLDYVPQGFKSCDDIA